MAMVKSVKEERPEVKPVAKKKRRSGKSNWASLNKQRKERLMALARRKKGLPVTRLRYKQSLPARRSGRCIQRAIRADDNVSMRLCSVGTQTPMSVSPSTELVDFCLATHGVYAAECLAMPYERAASACLPDTERAASACIPDTERAASALWDRWSAPRARLKLETM